MNLSQFPPWVLVGTGLVALVLVALVLAMVYEFVRPRARRRVRIGDMTVSVWVRQRRMPGAAGAIVVPVSPDLKMVAGIAKWARDATANMLQAAADSVAPLRPGEAFVGPGGRYRFQIGVLAVVMDAQKRSRPEWIRDGVAQALKLAREKDATSCVLPDFTADLVRQSRTITDEQRRETCAPIARAMLDGVLASGGVMDEVRIWVWIPGNEDLFIKQLDSLAERSGAGAVGRVATAG